MTQFWKKIIAASPDLVDTIVYFCPNTKANLPCILHADGTLSSLWTPELRFDAIEVLVKAWKSGELKVEESAYHSFPGRRNKTTAKTKLSFEKDFFFEPGRVKHINSTVRRRRLKNCSSQDGQNKKSVSLMYSVRVGSRSRYPDLNNYRPGLKIFQGSQHATTMYYGRLCYGKLARKKLKYGNGVKFQ